MADNIVPIENHNPITSELKVSSDGKGYVSFRGAARICGVDHKSIVRGGDFFNTKLTEKLVNAGFEVRSSGAEFSRVEDDATSHLNPCHS